MGVYINGMKMPKSCCECNIRYEMFCPLLHRFIADEGRRHNCPLGDVPTPHGRLIDADALKAWFVEWYDLNADLEIKHFLEILSEEDSAPPVIEAEEDRHVY